MIRPPTPLEAMDHALIAGTAGCVDPRKPGDVIKKLDPKMRAALQDLTSDELLKLRPYWK